MGDDNEKEKQDVQRNGLHEKDERGDFVTVNPTNDPKYPPGSYYVSYGDSSGHVTLIYDKDGNLIDQKE